MKLLGHIGAVIYHACCQENRSCAPTVIAAPCDKEILLSAQILDNAFDEVSPEFTRLRLHSFKQI